MLLRYRLHGHHGPLDLAYRLEVQSLASARLVLQTLVLHLDEVLHRQVLVRLVVVRLVLVRLVLVLHRQVLVRLVVVVPSLGLKQRGCCQVEPWVEVYPYPGSKRMDYYPDEVRQAWLRLPASHLQEAVRPLAQRQAQTRLPEYRPAQQDLQAWDCQGQLGLWAWALPAPS
jgi:hypothetical protein